MEEENTNMEAIPYSSVSITIDSSDLERIQARQATRKQLDRSSHSGAFTDALKDLRLLTNCPFICSGRGVFLLIEMILSIMLIVVNAAYDVDHYYDNYVTKIVGIAMNSITLLMCLVHLIAVATGIIERLPSRAIVFSLQMLKDIVLLVLQSGAFIFYFQNELHLPAGELILTVLLCCALIGGIILTSMEYKSKEQKEQKQRKKKKRWNKVSYKRLRHY